mmetsp:Transcript_76751/g.206853  ORF Transcript_76751/g.206853 Transcript_76751/m.206853 type:complete len:267 (-) Transcript_76751:95-895(-)
MVEERKSSSPTKSSLRAVQNLNLHRLATLLIRILDLAIADDERRSASGDARPVVIDDDRSSRKRESVHGNHVLGRSELVRETAVVAGANPPLQSISLGDGRGRRRVAEDHQGLTALVARDNGNLLDFVGKVFVNEGEDLSVTAIEQKRIPVANEVADTLSVFTIQVQIHGKPLASARREVKGLAARVRHLSKEIRGEKAEVVDGQRGRWRGDGGAGGLDMPSLDHIRPSKFGIRFAVAQDYHGNQSHKSHGRHSKHYTSSSSDQNG